MPKQTDWAYIAGIVDGEGCFCITKKTATGKKYSPSYEGYLIVAMTNLKLINWLKKNLGGWKTQVRMITSGKQMYRWQLESGKAISVVTKLLPYLQVKRKQALLFLKFRKHIDDYKLQKQGMRTVRISKYELNLRENIRLGMRELNA